MTFRKTLSESLAAAAWFLAALMMRAPIVARVEGTLDHDQSVVGLMALDIAAGRRFPIFFDGQRYMGAIEAYVAAVLVRIFGHTPVVIACAPLLFFGLFTAAQYLVWNAWRGRTAGHLAAALTILSAPMAVLWGVIPRGGYIEFAAWALPTLAAYRVVARRDRPPLRPLQQVGWGFLLALGFFINPMSSMVYATLALDWTLGRHGADLRREHGLKAPWLDGRFAPLIWFTIAATWLCILAFFCHVDPRALDVGFPYKALGGSMREPWRFAVGLAGTLTLLGLAAWWTRGPARLYRAILDAPLVLAGALTALTPFLIYNVLVISGRLRPAASLPMWIGAPWISGPNIQVVIRALGPLFGSAPTAINTVLIGQGTMPPPHQWPRLAATLDLLTPLVVVLALWLILRAFLSEGAFWKKVWSLRDDDVAPPVALAATFLTVALMLFLLQGTSPNGSSIRYLFPLWVVLPGLFATAILAAPRSLAIPSAACLMLAWGTAQFCLWVDLDREFPGRSLAAELEHREVPLIIASTPIALTVANLTHGKVGALEYQAIWPRLGARYAERVPREGPLVCVVDRHYPWGIEKDGIWPIELDLGRHLRGMASRGECAPRLVWTGDGYEIWEVAAPLRAILSTEPDLHRPFDEQGLEHLVRDSTHPREP